MKPTNTQTPLTPAVFYILFSLASGEKHGYEIMKEVKLATGGQVKMGSGTLYGSIKRMIADNLIEEAGDHVDTTLDDERRRYYRLTDLGKAALDSELQRYRELVTRAEQQGLLPLPGMKSS